MLSCYEAGRDGFWLHRRLLAQGVQNLVVDSASKIKRRARRAKTDHRDVVRLLMMPIHFDRGEKKVWSVVRVPGAPVEDRRHLHRQLQTLKGDRTRYRNRIQGLLAGQGIRLRVGADFLEQLSQVQCWDGSPCQRGCAADWKWSMPDCDLSRRGDSRHPFRPMG